MNLKLHHVSLWLLAFSSASSLWAASSPSTYHTTSPGTGQLWNSNATWTEDVTGTTTGYPDSANDSALLSSVATASSLNLNGGTYSIETLTVANGTGSWTIESVVGGVPTTGNLTYLNNFTDSSLSPVTISVNLSLGTPGFFPSGSTSATYSVISGGSTTITGNISDGFISDSLNCTGAGTLELDGDNTYSGGTNLSAGTLIAGNASAFGTGTMAVTGGTLMAGNGLHTITVGNYNQSAGTLYLNVTGVGQAATADKLQVNNTALTPATLGGNLTLNLTGFSSPSNALLELVSTSGYTGTFSSTTYVGLASYLRASLDYTTDDVFLQILLNRFSLVGLDPNEQGIVGPINNAMAAGNVSPSFSTLETALYSALGTAAFASDLDQLSPEKFGFFTSVTAFNNASFETTAMDSYLASQRGANGSFLAGNGTIDTSGLTMNDPDYDSGLQMVHSRLLAWNAAPLGDGLLSDVTNPMLAGTDMKDMKDSKDMKEMAPAYTDPWNFFVRGNVILAQGFSQTDVPHFDDNTESVVLGTDYRITPNFLVGLTAGYAHTDVTLDDNGSSATVDSYSPGLYASYADHGWYSNLSGSYVHNAYTEARNIPFLGQTASSAPEGNEGVANLDGGYDFHQGALTFGPLAGVQYTHLSVDGFTENGSVADLSVNEQDADSLRSRLGGHFSYSFNDCGVKITPHLDASWQHEFLDQSRGITSQFNAFGGGSFSVSTPNPSRDSALADAGVDADLNRTVTLFADYIAQAGQDNYFGQSVQAGVKIGF